MTSCGNLLHLTLRSPVLQLLTCVFIPWCQCCACQSPPGSRHLALLNPTPGGQRSTRERATLQPQKSLRHQRLFSVAAFHSGCGLVLPSCPPKTWLELIWKRRGAHHERQHAKRVARNP